MTEISIRELKLTAALYTLKNGVLDHVKATGTLPEAIPTGGSPIAMRLIIERRGTDIELTEDEKIVFACLLRAVREGGRLSGGAAILIDEERDRQASKEAEGTE